MKRLFLFSTLILGVLVSSQAQEIKKEAKKVTENVKENVKREVRNAKLPQESASVGSTPIHKGNWIVGGSVGSLGYSFEAKSFNIAISPTAGYFISNGVAVGLQLEGNFTSISGEDNVYGYGLLPFVRYYFPEGSSSTGRFFGQANVGIRGASNGSDASFAGGINLGYAHFITRSVALEASLGYNYSKAVSPSIAAQKGLGVTVGFQIYLPGKGNR